MPVKYKKELKKMTQIQEKPIAGNSNLKLPKKKGQILTN